MNLKCCSLVLNRGVYSVAIISVMFNTLDPSQQSNMAFRSFCEWQRVVHTCKTCVAGFGIRPVGVVSFLSVGRAHMKRKRGGRGRRPSEEGGSSINNAE